MNRTHTMQRFAWHPLIGVLSTLLLATTMLAGCGSASRTLVYPPTGTPTPRPDTLFALNFPYFPGRLPGLGPGSKARRILDPTQIQHFYEMLNAFPPYPLVTPSGSCISGDPKGYLLFLSHGQPTLEVDIEEVCGTIFAYLNGFVPGNPPQLRSAIRSDARVVNQAFVQMAEQAYQSGAPTPVQDIPYQPAPK